MSGITLSAGVRQNLLSMQNTASMMAETQNRLATGKKVNSALDNPTNFFTASNLQARSSDLSSLMDAMSNGVKTLEAASNGLDSITKSLESMQSTLRQARQDKSFETTSYTLDSTSITSASQLSFSGGSVGETAVDVDMISATAETVSTVEAGADFVPSAATAGKFTLASGDFATSTFGTGDTITFNLDEDGNGDEAITVTAAMVSAAGNGDATIDDVDELAEVVNAALAANGNTNATASVNDDGDLEITSGSTGDSSTIAITSITANDNSTDGTVTVAGLSSGTETDGAAPADKTFTLSLDGGTTSTTITLDGATVTDAASARASIQAQIDADENLAGKITVGGEGEEISLEGEANGATSITVGGTDVDDVFGASRTVTAGETKAATVDELVATINNTADLKGKVRASNDDGKLRIENQSTQELTVGGTTSTGKADGGAGSQTISGNTIRADLADQFNELRDQLDKLSDDASFNGVNLLRGDNLKITFNETGTSTIDIQTKDGETVNSASLGLSDITEEDLDSDANIDSLLGDVKSALNSIRSQSSTFGSNLSVVENRKDFTTSMMNTLQTGADNLVLADGNEEAANMLALQTRQQLSSTALSLASQADQAALRLF